MEGGTQGIPAYQWSQRPGEHQVQEQARGSRMAKRRRLDDGGGAGPRVWQQEQQYDVHGARSFGAPPPHQGNASNNHAGLVTSTAYAQADGANGGAEHEPGPPPTYPEVVNYQQPYYQHQHHGAPAYQPPWTANEPQHYVAGPGPYPVAANHQPSMPLLQETSSEPQPAYHGSAALATAGAPFDVDPAVQYESFSGIRPNGPRTGTAFYYEDASMHLKIQSLPILDNLATQLIQTLAKSSFNAIAGLMHGGDSEDSQAYHTLKNLFDQTRKVYSRETPFIDAIAIQMFSAHQQEIIRKANIATFVSSILGAHDVSFFHLNEFYLETFVPLGHRLLKWQGGIMLELKTQTYISALMNSDGSPEAMLDELFPGDLDAQILTRHPDAPSLSPSEQDFVDRSRARKQYLLAEPPPDEALSELPKKYQWTDFLREFASCINKNVEGLVNHPARVAALSAAERKQPEPDHGAQANQVIFPSDANNTTYSQALPTKAQNPGPGDAARNDGSVAAIGAPNAEGDRQESDTPPRKVNAPTSTVRQPWKREEEDALLEGLDRVSGPHWSQILALFGRGGSISEILKDRNQVQLKDKARNLKLWYLKMGKEVPPSLRGVTGELRKRGGARARAALGLLDDDAAGGAESGAQGQIDPSLEQPAPTGTRGGRKKTARKA